MGNKIRRLTALITNNFGIKLLAIIVSLGLWFVVNNINDPLERVRFNNIPIEIVNAEQLTSSGKVYEIVDNAETVNVEVTGKRSVLRDITRENIRAIADMEKLTIVDTIGIEISSTRNNSELEFKCSLDSVKLSIEDIKRVQMPINTLTSGLPAQGYIVGPVTPSQNTVQLSGPESVISRVAHVAAVVNIDEFPSDIITDISTSVELRLYDASGDDIKSKSIKMNISTVNVVVSILATKEIPVEFVLDDEPAQGYIANGNNKSVPESVLVAGKKAVLDNMAKISVSDDALSLVGKTESLNATVNIKNYLPAGVQFADSSYNGDVNATIGVEPLVSKDLMIPAKNFAAGFRMHEKPDEFEADIEGLAEGTQFRVRVSGTKDALDEVKEESVIVVIDMDKTFEKLGLDEWTAGRYEGEAVFDFKLGKDAKIDTDRIYRFTVVLSEKE